MQVLEYPILKNKHYQQPSVFKPENLIREARRQKGLRTCKIPKICVLDPDGDLAKYLIQNHNARENNCWACYHSNLYDFTLSGTAMGVVPQVVGASYAVLVAEQLFQSGCKLLISITSAGLINHPKTSHKFALITEAVRDEGTSYHYLPANKPSVLPANLMEVFAHQSQELWFPAKSWTTDAPYRETQPAIEAMKAEKVTCVEMEAAALYAFALSQKRKVLCFAHLTNTMAQEEGDFEKGEYFGSLDSLQIVETVLKIYGNSSKH